MTRPAWQAAITSRFAIEPTVNAMQRHLLFTMRSAALQSCELGSGTFQTRVEREDGSWEGIGSTLAEAMARALLAIDPTPDEDSEAALNDRDTGHTTEQLAIDEVQMTTNAPNPYMGRTRYTPRPAKQQPEYRLATLDQLAVAQARWDAADKIREQHATDEAEFFERLTRYEVREEPLSKAVENRLRVAFLGSKGGTMKAWLEQRDGIIGALDRTE